jgi:hypothetical protein
MRSSLGLLSLYAVECWSSLTLFLALTLRTSSAANVGLDKNSEKRRRQTLVLASCMVRHRYFTGIANIGDVSFYAGLKAALARLGA